MNVVDQLDPTPLYVQLANILRAMIESGGGRCGRLLASCALRGWLSPSAAGARSCVPVVRGPGSRGLGPVSSYRVSVGGGLPFPAGRVVPAAPVLRRGHRARWRGSPRAKGGGRLVLVVSPVLACGGAGVARGGDLGGSGALRTPGCGGGRLGRGLRYRAGGGVLSPCALCPNVALRGEGGRGALLCAPAGDRRDDASRRQNSTSRARACFSW
jgi:hypothetical protein